MIWGLQKKCKWETCIMLGKLPAIIQQLLPVTLLLFFLLQKELGQVSVPTSTVPWWPCPHVTGFASEDFVLSTSCLLAQEANENISIMIYSACVVCQAWFWVPHGEYLISSHTYMIGTVIAMWSRSLGAKRTEQVASGLNHYKVLQDEQINQECTEVVKEIWEKCSKARDGQGWVCYTGNSWGLLLGKVTCEPRMEGQKSAQAEGISRLEGLLLM